MSETPVETIHLFDPEHDSLSYGPADEIKFGAKGGFDHGHWIGPADHPLLPGLLSSWPAIRVADAPVTNIYVCEACGAEFGTKAGLRSHQKTHQKTHA